MILQNKALTRRLVIKRTPPVGGWGFNWNLDAGLGYRMRWFCNPWFNISYTSLRD